MALMTGLKNINDVMSLTKNDLVIMYGKKNFDYMNVRILTLAIKFINQC